MLIAGGIIRCCMHSTALMTPAMPADSKVWPMLALTLVMGIFRPGGKTPLEHFGHGVQFRGVAHLRGRGVSFEVLQLAMSRPLR